MQSSLRAQGKPFPNARRTGFRAINQPDFAGDQTESKRSAFASTIQKNLAASLAINGRFASCFPARARGGPAVGWLRLFDSFFYRRSRLQKSSDRKSALWLALFSTPSRACARPRSDCPPKTAGTVSYF